MSYNHADYCSKEKCLTTIIKKIIRAQDLVAERDHCCEASCAQSIRDLRSSNRNNNQETTIPIMLTCKDCEAFTAEGMRYFDGCYNPIQTKFFKTIKFVEGSHHCVKLELLKPIYECDLTRCISGFLSTGVCITVDLDCFCAISCLKPTTPLDMTTNALEEK